jgi:ABC-type uncharacterized transport system substrate-binding protein
LPSFARAQPKQAVIGFLGSRAAGESAELVEAFRQALREAGHIEGQNLTIVYRWADGAYDRLPALAADLVRRSVDVIITVGGAVAAQAAKSATKTIPIVFNVGDDPIKFGLVSSLNRPGGNITGVSLILGALGAKRLELLHELVPSAHRIAFLVNPDGPNMETEINDVTVAARAFALQIQVLHARRDADFDQVFAEMDRTRPIALVTASDPFFASRRTLIVAQTLKHRVPAIYTTRIWTAAGGLMSYGTDLTVAYRQAGAYVAQILKGANPGELPVVQSAKFEFVINTKTAKALGIEVSHKLLALADEVIE